MWVLENPVSASVLTLLAVCAVTITILALREHSFAGVGGQMLSPAAGSSQSTERARNSLETLLTQVQQTALRVDSSIGDKISQLEAASRAANERVLELQQLARQTAEIERFARGQSEQAPRTRFSPSETPRDIEADNRVASAFERPSILGPTIGHERPTAGTGRVIGPVDMRSARVCELVDAGTAPINIAEALDMTLGEVELILNLRQMR